MKAITLWQPWASLVAVGAKTIETRSWSTKHRGPLAIHAAAKRPRNHEHHNVNDDLPPAIDLYAMSAHWDWWEHPDYTLHGGLYRWRGPLGAVVATARLVDVLPMTTHADIGDPECIVVHDDGLDHCIPSWEKDQTPEPDWLVRLEPPVVPDGAHLIRDISDQRPFGDYRPGRYGWLLDDIEPVDPPVPARGYQQLWEWTP